MTQDGGVEVAIKWGAGVDGCVGGRELCICRWRDYVATALVLPLVPSCVCCFCEDVMCDRDKRYTQNQLAFFIVVMYYITKLNRCSISG